MSSLESYLVAVAFIALSASLLGIVMGGVYAIQKGTVDDGVRLPDDATKPGLIAIVCIPVSIAYGIAWGIALDGPHFVWIPGVLAWFTAYRVGRKVYRANFAAANPFLVPMWGVPILPTAYHLIHPYMA